MAVYCRIEMEYLSNQFWLAFVCDVILSDVSMQPVAEVNIFVIQGDKNVSDET